MERSWRSKRSLAFSVIIGSAAKNFSCDYLESQARITSFPENTENLNWLSFKILIFHAAFD